MSLDAGDKLGDVAYIVKLKGYCDIPQVIHMLIAAEGSVKNLEHCILMPLKVAFLTLRHPSQPLLPLPPAHAQASGFLLLQRQPVLQELEGAWLQGACSTMASSETSHSVEVKYSQTHVHTGCS